MRPDQHKQKKNNQYKKKHGISDRTKVDLKENKSQKESQVSKKGVSTDISQKKKELSEIKDRNKEASTSEISDSDEDVQIAGNKSTKKGFQRRKVVSNWDRYDLPPEAEETETHGEDFSKLLQASGSSTSQFRFKDEEEEWETTDQSDCLSLDLKDLSSCVGCVPLYRVLRLNKDMLSAEQIDEFDRMSVDQQERYKASVDVKCTNLQNSVPSKKTAKPNNEPNISLSVESNALDELLDSVVLESSSSKDKVRNLSLETSGGSDSTSQNDLDDLLNSGSKTVSPVSVLTKESPVSCEKSSKPAESNDLEDWLDSVLDS